MDDNEDDAKDEYDTEDDMHRPGGWSSVLGTACMPLKGGGRLWHTSVSGTTVYTLTQPNTTKRTMPQRNTP